jgi:hypothetical protein
MGQRTTERAIPTSRQSRDETTHERPSSFRETLYRDRRLVSRREMDRRIADRAAERNPASVDEHETYFPALRRWLSGGTLAEVRAVALVAVLVIAAFLFGRWVGQQDAPDPATGATAVVQVI